MALHEAAKLAESWKVLAPHVAQLVLAVRVAAEATYCPAAQAVNALQVVRPVTSANVPALHGVHDAAMLEAAVNAPTGHTVHTRSALVDPALLMNDPALHVCIVVHDAAVHECPRSAPRA